MSFARTVVGLIFVSVLIFYLTSIGSMQDEAKWGAFALMAVLAFAWVQLGHREKVANLAPRKAVRSAKTPVEEVEEEVEEQQSNIPAPVKVGSTDGTTLKERKMAKVQAANADKALAMAEADASEDMDVVVEMEEVHVADEFVIEVSPESIEDADIDVTVNQKKIQHAEIRQRVEKRRRGHLAEIRASTVKLQQQQDIGEDLVALLQTAGHGHSILDEPLNPAPGHVYGATFIRIDESRILKLRTALDTGFEAVEKPEVVLPQLIGIDGNPLPALLGLDGKPLPMPLPMPGASGALAAMKSEISE
ncbi:MAG: hypothetical protein OSB30_00665 [Candidatus Poseidoniaceae archaeon]|nr:hypothetical protein [Candidatus Poseidoniaceae archaeon]